MIRDNSQIKSRISEYIKYHEISNYEFSKRTGISKGVLEQDNGITEKNLYRLLNYDPKINLDWLIWGKGNIYNKPNPSNSNVPVNSENILENKAEYLRMLDSIINQLRAFENTISAQKESTKILKEFFKNLKPKG